MSDATDFATDFSLEGEVALVTGVATGIGRAVAVALARAGADVAVTVNQSPADETVAQVEAMGRRCQAFPCDLSELSPDKAVGFLDKVERELGQVTVLVNNAGIIRRSPAATHSQDDWQAVIKVNLDAVWTLSQAVGKRMLERGGGKIVTIASLLSFQGGVTVPAYTASKHAVAGLTKALANEWASKNINVNAVAPGYIRTANTQALQDDETRNRQIVERIPAGDWGQPEDITGAVVFLASDAARYIHGHVLVVDGGWLAR